MKLDLLYDFITPYPSISSKWRLPWGPQTQTGRHHSYSVFCHSLWVFGPLSLINFFSLISYCLRLRSRQFLQPFKHTNFWILSSFIYACKPTYSWLSIFFSFNIMLILFYYHFYFINNFLLLKSPPGATSLVGPRSAFLVIADDDFTKHFAIALLGFPFFQALISVCLLFTSWLLSQYHLFIYFSGLQNHYRWWLQPWN